MKREDVVAAAQILSNMKAAAEKLEKSLKKNNKDEAATARKQMLEMQAQIANLI